MDDRELIIDALRDYERQASASLRLTEQSTRLAENVKASASAIYRARGEGALRIRAELQDNPDYIVKGGGA